MLKAALALVLLWALFSDSKIQAGWETSPGRAASSDGQPEPVGLRWLPNKEQGHPTFQAALQKLADEGRVQQLKNMFFVLQPSDETFQKEIFQQLEVVAPKELKEALKSAGNMHNPKMTALSASFEKAVLATPTVKQYNEDLARHQMEVAGLSFEKLFLAPSGDTKRFSCIMWLLFGKKSTKAPAP